MLRSKIRVIAPRLGMTDVRFLCIVDMGVLPMTFDVAGFLVCADIQREISGFSKMSVIIVKGSYGQIGRKPAEAMEKEKLGIAQLHKRFHGIVIQLPWLLDSVEEVYVTGCREEVDAMTWAENVSFWPNHYQQKFYNTLMYESHRYFWYKQHRINEHYSAGHDVRRLRAPSYALEDTSEWLDKIRSFANKPLLVATIREYDQSKTGRSRNTDSKTWVDCLNKAVDEWEIILLRDASNADIPIEGIRPEVRTPSRPLSDIAYRVALYELADLSISHEGGYGILMQLNPNVSYAQYYIVDDDSTARDHHTKRSMRIKGGMEPGKDLVFASNNQRIRWGNGSSRDVQDFLESIIKQHR
jgi:hypothetical protein